MQTDEIERAIMQLPEEQRFDLITRLWESLPDSAFGLDLDDPNLEAELERRSSDLEGAVEWSQLRNER